MAMESKLPHANDWIVRTKLSPPRASAGEFARHRLLRVATGPGDVRLTLVHAPAGYGKTTFLKQWYDHRLGNGGAASWLSLDEEEKSAGQFVGYLLAALRSAGVGCDSLERSSRRGSESPRPGSVAALTINALQEFGRNLVLFFDDYHLIEQAWSNEFFQKVVERLPENVEVVMSSRSRPHLRVENLRYRGEVREFSVAELAFSLEELQSLLDLKLSRFELRRLRERTEGWPLVCRMIDTLYQSESMAVRGLEEVSSGSGDFRPQSTAVRGLEEFSGRSGDFASYVTEQVFSSLAEDERQFLLRTSITGRFSGDLAKALCPEIDSWSILDRFRRNHFFLVSLDAEGNWYRYHQLFREYLYEKLRRMPGADLEALHERAATWLRDAGLTQEAVDQALKAGADGMAARMLESQGGWRLIYQDRLDWVAGVLDRIDKSVLSGFPRLFLAELVLLVKSGRAIQAMKLAEEISSRTAGYREWAGKPLGEGLRIEFELVRRLFLEDYVDRPVGPTTLALMKNSLHSLRDDDILKALIHDALAAAHADAGELNEAERHVDEAEIVLNRCGYRYEIIYILFHRANVCMERARLHRAADVLQTAEDYGRRHFDADSDVIANVAAFKADLAFMQNRLEDAERHVESALNLVQRRDGWFDLYAKAYTTAASLALTTTGWPAAAAVLNEARATADRRCLPRLGTLGDLLELKLLLLDGNVPEANEFAETIGIDELARDRSRPDDLSAFLPDRAAMALARLRLSRNDPRGAFELLRRLMASLERQGRVRLLVEAWLLMARSRVSLGENRAAGEYLDRAVHACVHEGYLRPFLDEGEAVSSMLHAGDSSTRTGNRNRFEMAFRSKVVAAIRQEQLARKAIGRLGLSPKEHKVVLQLAKGLTNRQIAAALYVSEDTVKYRLKKLFRKWNVHSRQDAVRFARRKSLLS